MFLTLHTPDCDRCDRCRSTDKAGYVLEDDQHVKKFLCLACLSAVLRNCLTPLRTVGVES